MLSLLWVYALVFAAMWAFGFALNLWGGFIHLLLLLVAFSVGARIVLGHRLA
jgi:hypothetical protein